MLKRKITLKHIARELEVSISTVSKALKNSEEISRDIMLLYAYLMSRLIKK